MRILLVDDSSKSMVAVKVQGAITSRRPDHPPRNSESVKRSRISISLDYRQVALVLIRASRGNHTDRRLPSRAFSRKRLPPHIGLSAMPTVTRTTDGFLPFLDMMEQLKPSLVHDIHLLS